MAKSRRNSTSYSVFEVAILLKELSAKKPEGRPTRDEWVSQYSRLGMVITNEAINSALTLAEIDEQSVFASPVDRARRLIEQVERVEKKLEGIENKTLIPLVNRMVAIEQAMQKKADDFAYTERITGLEEEVRSLFAKWDEMNETLKK